MIKLESFFEELEDEESISQFKGPDTYVEMALEDYRKRTGIQFSLDKFKKEEEPRSDDPNMFSYNYELPFIELFPDSSLIRSYLSEASIVIEIRQYQGSIDIRIMLMMWTNHVLFDIAQYQIKNNKLLIRKLHSKDADNNTTIFKGFYEALENEDESVQDFIKPPSHFWVKVDIPGEATGDEGCTYFGFNGDRVFVRRITNNHYQPLFKIKVDSVTGVERLVGIDYEACIPVKYCEPIPAPEGLGDIANLGKRYENLFI